MKNTDTIDENMLSTAHVSTETLGDLSGRFEITGMTDFISLDSVKLTLKNNR